MKSALCYSLILLLGIAPAVTLAQRGRDDETDNQGRNNSQGNRGQNDNSPNRSQQNSTPNRSQRNNTSNRGQGNPNQGNAPSARSFNQGQNQNQLNRGNVQAQPNNRGRSGNTGNNRGNNQNNKQNNQNNPSRGKNVGSVDPTPGVIQPDTLILGPGNESPGSTNHSNPSGTDAAPWDGAAWFPDSGKGDSGKGDSGKGDSGKGGSGKGGSGTGGAGTGTGTGGRGSLGDRGTRGDGSTPGGRGDGKADGRGRGDGQGRGDGNARGDGRGRGDGNARGNGNWGRGGNWNSDYDWRRNNTTVNNYVNVTPRYYHGHGNWHRGDWNSFWGPSWGYQPYIYTSWGIRPGYFSFGYTALAAPWTWGYYNYVNPYWVVPVNVVPYVDYSQPIIVAAAPAQQQQPVLPGVQQTAEQQAGVLFDKARVEFLKGNYQQALNAANEAVALTPNDAVLHEFRALCLFALKDYQQAAAGLYAILSVGPGWDWETMAGLYGDVAKYTAQMKALEDYRRENPDVAEARFVLGYHYLVLGHKPQAAVELEKAVSLKPDDQLSKQLLQGIAMGDVQTALPPEPTPAQALPADGLVGNWSAQNPDGSKFGLALNGDNEFQWTVSRDGQQQEMAGTYKLENNYLILKASAENSLVGQVTMDGDKRFVFKLAGKNPADPGLTFTK